MFEFKESKGGKREEINELKGIIRKKSDIPEIIERITNFKPEGFILLETFKILDQKGLIDLLSAILQEFECFLKENIKIKAFFELVDEDLLNLMKIKIWGSFTKFRMFFLKPTLDGLNLDIFLKNGYETHGKIIKRVFLINFIYE